MMDDREIKLRLIEAAAQTPAVRQHLAHDTAAAAAHAMALVWYNNFVNANTGTPGKPAPDGKRR